MKLLWKEDWEETKERLILWWQQEYFGRCALRVTAPRKNPPDLPPPPPPQSPEQRHYDLDWISRNKEYHLSRAFFGGEALPQWCSGTIKIPALLGCPTTPDLTSVWCHPILTDPDRIDVRSLRLDEDGDHYRFMLQLQRRDVRESRGKAVPGIGLWGYSGDTLADLRGTEQLLIDCLERPDEVRAAEEYLTDLLFDLYDRCFEIIRDAAEGSTAGFGFWAPGKYYVVGNDFSTNIGPEMFREIFLPEIRRQTEFFDYCFYHVDGVDAFRHVDALCELPRLQAIQILPGAGKPSPLHYLDTLKKVQNAGKNLYIDLAPDEVGKALAQLSARGLFIQTETETEDDARALLQSVEQWSVDRG